MTAAAMARKRTADPTAAAATAPPELAPPPPATAAPATNWTPEMDVCMIAATAASPAAIVHTREESSRVFTPSDAARSSFSAAPRMAMPSDV